MNERDQITARRCVPCWLKAWLWEEARSWAAAALIIAMFALLRCL